MSETDGKAGVLSSLGRFFDVLEYLDTMPREVSIRQVSEDLSINKATVYRILKPCASAAMPIRIQITKNTL